LFGLSAFTAQRRQSEIGFRKVIGAAVDNVELMLSMDFLKLASAVLIAFPVACATGKWLQSFAYGVNVDGGIFLAAGTSIKLITAIAIGYQAIGRIDKPVKSLRSE
jgi:hypothetical protein